jgi:hypothetical protein
VAEHRQAPGRRSPDSESTRLVTRALRLARQHRGVGIAQVGERGRQDLDPGACERVLDGGMQVGVQPQLRVRIVRQTGDLVADVEVIERTLIDDRRGLALDAGDGERRLDEERMHLSPLDVVADGDLRVQPQPALGRAPRVVEDRARQDAAVGQRDLLVAQAAQLGGERAERDHVTDVLADAHAIAEAERARVRSARARR